MTHKPYATRHEPKGLSMLANVFTDWLTLRAAEIGLDISDPEFRPVITVVAAEAATGTLPDSQVAKIAELLQCTAEEVRAATVVD